MQIAAGRGGPGRGRVVQIGARQGVVGRGGEGRGRVGSDL